MKYVMVFICALFVHVDLIPQKIVYVNEADMWWCSGCSLCYPTSQKVCLNKDCPLYRKPKSAK